MVAIAMNAFFPAWFLSVAVVTAGASYPIPVPGGNTSYLSTFDDLNAVPVVAVQVVGPYNGLDMNLRLAQAGVLGKVTIGLLQASSPNTAAYDQSIVRPQITTQYAGSVTKTFDFTSFYSGCVASAMEAAVVPVVSCNIRVQGYRASKLVAKQEFRFRPGLKALRAPAKKYRLSSDFSNLDTVTFESRYAVTGVLGVTVLDDLEYTVYYAD